MVGHLELGVFELRTHEAADTLITNGKILVACLARFLTSLSSRYGVILALNARDDSARDSCFQSNSGILDGIVDGLVGDGR